MRLISGRAWALVLVSALLQTAIFPIAGPLPLWRAALCWIALVPLLVALLEPSRSGAPLTLGSAMLLGYVCGICWYMGTCYWIYQTMHIYGSLPGPVAFGILILFSLYLGLYHALFAALLGYLRARFGVRTALLLAPLIWVAVELARARITSFPWDLLGYSQVDNLFLTRLAPVAGVMAISFVIAAVNASLAYFFLADPKRIALPAAAAVIAVVVQLLGSVGRNSPAAIAPTRNAVMMQENIEVGAPGKKVEQLTEAQELQQFSNWSLHPEVHVADGGASSAWSTGAAAPNPTVIIWPEAPSDLFSVDAPFRRTAGELATTANAPVIAGSLGLDRDVYRTHGGLFKYDSATIFDNAGTYLGRYDKIHLVPFGEYVPYKEVFSFASKLTAGVGDMDRGTKRKVFSLGGQSYGVFVCYESIFGDEVREFAKNGAEVLVNISDDGWYGDSGAPWQHLNMARMRAIENHRWLLRSTNTGVTTAIDPRGRMAFQAPRHVRAAYVFPFAFEPASNLTFYTRHGDWLAWLCAIVTLLAAAYAYATPLTPEHAVAPDALK